MALKLTSGEELIAKVNIINENEFELHDSRLIIVVPGPNGGQVKLAPVLFSVDIEQLVTLNRKTVSIYTTNVYLKFLEEYTRLVSPLSIPRSSILMG